MDKLRRETALLGLTAFVLWSAMAGAVRSETSTGGWWIFSGLSACLLLYQLVHLYRNLDKNQRLDEPEILLESLGAANWITVLRAFLLAFLPGFLILPRPEGWFVWVPGVLYLTAALLDYLDGSVARLTRRSTRLGEVLDMHWDGFGMLAASALLVHYEQVPVWYILVGLARYLFLFGLWLLRRMDRPVYELPQNVFRRALAGLQMGFVAVVLLPVFAPPVTWVGAWLFGLPFLFGFLRDWLFVCGALNPHYQRGAFELALRRWMPGVLRLLLVAAVLFFLFDQIRLERLRPEILMIFIGAGLALLLGAAGRFFALTLAVMSAFLLLNLASDWRLWLFLVLGVAVATFGTGRLSLWKPEEWLIYHRVGDSGET